MASSIEPPVSLKSKLARVDYLLDGATRRLQEEASKCEIFATKASASGSSSLQNNGDHHVPKDLARTMNDITTLKSVLSCPIFNRIVNVTDSLDKLSYQLNLHPSIGPTDIDIDVNGELILTPPIEPTALNNLVNSKLEELVENSNNNSQQFISSEINQANKAILQAHQNQITRQQAQQNNLNGSLGVDSSTGFSHIHQSEALNNGRHHDPLQKANNQGLQNYVRLQNTIASSDIYDNQKKILTDDTKKTTINSNKPIKPDKFKVKEAAVTEENSRLYRYNGNFMLDQVLSANNIEAENRIHSTQMLGQIGDQVNDTRKNGYSNEMYKSAIELTNQENMTLDQHQTQLNGQQYNSYSKTSTGHNLAASITKVQALQNSGVAHNRGSCSPSTSAGSTVRLADDCDSGASSYQSQNAKVSSYSPFLYKSTDHDTRTAIQPTSRENRVGSIEQELIENLSPELERIQVTLTKEDNSLGITIAGYTCEKEEISGIFIKSITPNSPADKSGKIRTLDQIFAVNGRELLGYSNPEAVNVLKNTDKVVTLQLMRYLAESKYRILETAVANAEPVTSSLRASANENVVSKQPDNVTGSPAISSISVSRSKDNSQSPTKLTTPHSNRPTFLDTSNSQQVMGNQHVEAIYKNETVMNTTSAPALNNSSQSRYSQNEILMPGVRSQIPVAAQRGGTNKVIETKQGARNTIDIRSPVCQTNAATYVNKVVEMELGDLDKKSLAGRLQREVSDDEFRSFVTSEEPEWERDAQIIELNKGVDRGLGFTVKEYANPKDQKQSIIMIISLTLGGIAERDGRLSVGDLLIFVDDTNLEGASLAETVRALKRTNGQVRLGVLKLKRNREERNQVRV